MAVLKRLMICALALCLLTASACAEGWSQAYLNELSQGVSRHFALCDITDDNEPELIDIVTKAQSSSLRIKYISSGSAVRMTSSDFDFDDFSIKKLKAAKFVLRKDENGNACLFVRMLGANDDVRLAFTSASSGKLNLKLNLRKSVLGGKTSYYVNSSAAKIVKYQNALAAFNSSYSKKGDVPLKTIYASEGASSIKKKFNALAKAFDYDPAPAPDPVPVPGKQPVIVDISQHNYKANNPMDWAKIAANVDLLILRCGVTRTYTEPIGIGVDAKFAYYAKMCKQYGIPFGVYYYGKVSTVEEAKLEAKKTWDVASPYNPLFYVYDAEESMLTKKVIETYMKTLQSLGAKKTGYYIAHHLYSTYKLDTSLVDFIWIPRYGGKAPNYKCDLHQHTSTGTVPGIPGVVDMNQLTGTKTLKWFLKR